MRSQRILISTTISLAVALGLPSAAQATGDTRRALHSPTRTLAVVVAAAHHNQLKVLRAYTTHSSFKQAKQAAHEFWGDPTFDHHIRRAACSPLVDDADGLGPHADCHMGPFQAVLRQQGGQHRWYVDDIYLAF